jgi:hypothetical protein
MSPSTFDPAKFVLEIEAMGADLRASAPFGGRPEIKKSIGYSNPRKAQIDARWKEEMTSPERCHAVIEFLLKRQG